MATNYSDFWLQKVAYECPSIVMSHGSDAARQMALCVIFYSSGWKWVDGAPCKVEAGKVLSKWGKVTTKTNWRSPLILSGESTMDLFIKNNVAAKAYLIALEQALKMAKRPSKEAKEIISRAVSKMYPEYIKGIKSLSAEAVSSVTKKINPLNVDLWIPTDDSLLANVPSEVDENWKELLREALFLPKTIVGIYGQNSLESVKATKKWTDKMARSMKKKVI